MNRKQVLGSLCIAVDDSQLTLNQVNEDPNLTLLCPDIELTVEVDVYSAVVGEESTLINSGDYIKFSDSSSTVRFAVNSW